MFSKLQRKIGWAIVGATTLFVLVISSVTATVIGSGYVNSFRQSAADTVAIALDYSRIKIDGILAEGLTLSRDETILTGLDGTNYAVSVNPKLNFFRSQHQEEVSGLALYAENGHLYRTDSLPLADIVPWTEIVGRPETAGVAEGTEDHALFLVPSRTDPHAMRWLGLLLPIRSESAMLGHLLIAIDIDYLFNGYFRFAGVDDFLLEDIFLSAMETWWNPAENDPYQPETALWEAAQTEDDGFLNGNRTFLVSAPFYRPEYRLTVLIGTRPLWNPLFELIGWLGLIDLLFILGSIVIARHEAKSIAERLGKLQRRMKTATDLIE